MYNFKLALKSTRSGGQERYISSLFLILLSFSPIFSQFFLISFLDLALPSLIWPYRVGKKVLATLLLECTHNDHIVH